MSNVESFGLRGFLLLVLLSLPSEAGEEGRLGTVGGDLACPSAGGSFLPSKQVFDY